MAEDVALHHRPDGVAVTHQALSPKRGGGWHTMWWTGPDPKHPQAAVWHPDPAAAAVYPTAAAAVDAFAALGNGLYRVPAPQLQLTDSDAEDADMVWQLVQVGGPAAVAALDRVLRRLGDAARAEVRAQVDVLRRQRAAALDLADRAEHGCLRWADPLPVPEWVGRLRQALGARRG